MKEIKSCKVQLDRDAALGVHGVLRNPIVQCTFHHPISTLKIFFFQFLFLFRCQWTQRNILDH
jgi:hypothetical protein